MTPETRASECVQSLHARYTWAYDPVQHAELEAIIADAFRMAEKENRDRIAMWLRKRATNYWNMALRYDHHADKTAPTAMSEAYREAANDLENGELLT